MVFQGHVENGHIVLEGAVSLPEGTKVSVIVSAPDSQPAGSEQPIPTLYERLQPVIGAAQGMPVDAARNLDHYLYGHPKQ